MGRYTHEIVSEVVLNCKNHRCMNLVPSIGMTGNVRCLLLVQAEMIDRIHYGAGCALAEVDGVTGVMTKEGFKSNES